MWGAKPLSKGHVKVGRVSDCIGRRHPSLCGCVRLPCAHVLVPTVYGVASNRGTAFTPGSLQSLDWNNGMECWTGLVDS